MQEDSIEHYASCAVCLHFLKHKVNFHGRVDRGHLVALGANSGVQSEDHVCRLAMWCYVLYKTFNELRVRIDNGLGIQDILHMMEQFLRDGGGVYLEAVLPPGA